MDVCYTDTHRALCFPPPPACRYKWNAIIKDKSDNNLCYGALIADQAVVTAATCVFAMLPADLKARPLSVFGINGSCGWVADCVEFVCVPARLNGQ